MVAAFNDIQKVWRLHVCAYALEEIQRAKRIARALHKQDWRGQSAQHFIAQFCSVAHRAKRISKTNQPVHFFGAGDMTADASAHALADQNCDGSRLFLLRLSQRLSMSGVEFWQWYVPVPATCYTS